MDAAFSKKGQCKNCRIPVDGVLYRKITTSGSVNYTWVCPVCNRCGCFGGDLWIPKDKVESHLTIQQLEAVPTLFDRVENRCVVCGSRYGEIHHWAPRAMWGTDECERWPKDYLCKKCHDQWHRQVTPQLVNPDGQYAD